MSKFQEDIKIIDVFEEREQCPVLDIDVSYIEGDLSLILNFSNGQRLNVHFNSAEVFKSANDCFDYDEFYGEVERTDPPLINHKDTFRWPCLEISPSLWSSKVQSHNNFRHFEFLSYDHCVHVLAHNAPVYKWLD